MGDFIDDFIQEYKRQPSLWQTSHPDFKNRKKRQDAYMKLIEVANKHNEAYNIERTKQKINNLRCAFRVQLKKFNEVKNNSKDGKEETYCPKRKYFESLMFLLNEETSAAKSIIIVKSKALTKRNSLIGSRTRNKTLSRKKIDKELEAITLDLKEDLESDENYLAQSLESEKENKSKSDSYEENEEAFNLALIEEEENLSVCNTKEIDPDAFESIIEEDDQSNKEMQSDFIKISRVVSIAESPSNELIQSQKSPPMAKQNVKRDHTEDNIILQSNPPTPSVTLTTSPSSTATTMATRAQYRQVQTKPIPTTPTTSQNNITKFTPLSHNNKNARVVQVRSVKALINNSTIQTVQSPTKQSQPQNQSINSNPQKRLVTGQTSSPSTYTVSNISSLSTAKPNVVSPIIAQKVVLPKVSTSGQQITIRNTSNQITAKPITIPKTGITITAPQRKSNDEKSFNNEAIESQTKKIKLDFDSSNLEKILSLACTKLKQEDNEDDFTVFGRMVTCKLKTMDTEQALISQRLITEILFDGQMKLLQLPQQNSTSQHQKNNITTSNIQQLFTQPLHATPITSFRHLNTTSGQAFYISEMNGNNSNIDSGTIQFSTNNSGGNVGNSGNDC